MRNSRIRASEENPDPTDNPTELIPQERTNLQSDARPKPLVRQDNRTMSDNERKMISLFAFRSGQRR